MKHSFTIRLCFLLPLAAFISVSTLSGETKAPGVLARAIQPLVDQQKVAGAVLLVADKDKVLAVETTGYANPDTKALMKADNVFWIASMTKSITGTAMMLLVDEGKVKIDDPVEKYLPEFKGQMVQAQDSKEAAKTPTHAITIREVLSHTSGLVKPDDKRLKKQQNLKTDVAQIGGLPLIREPGTKYEYNNSGINTAGRIIEVVSGMSYVEFVQQRLFTPLGMKDTTFWPSVEQGARLARSVRLEEGQAVPHMVKTDAKVTKEAVARLSEGKAVPQEVLDDYGFGKAIDYAKQYGEPAGGLFSTADDLGRFCRMVLNGGMFEGKRYLSEKAIKTMTTSQTNGVAVTPTETYGLGWSVKTKDDEGPTAGSFGHRGARRTAMWMDPQNGLAMVILVQHFNMPNEVQKAMYGPFLRAAIATYGKGKASASAAEPK